MSDFKYDIAFSLLAPDAPTGAAIDRRLTPRFTTFFFPDRQDELVGRDGLDAFSAVFLEESRAVVILYRDGWGTTKWTRIEENAIKRRCFEKGFDFLLLIPLEHVTQLPLWYSPHRIYFDLEEWGTEQAAAVIESFVRRAGGTPHVETLEERTARLNKRLEAEKSRADFRFSIQGVSAAKAELERLFSEIESRAAGVSVGGATLTSKRTSDGGRPVLVIWAGELSLSVSQAIYAMNNLAGSEMVLTIWKGPSPYLGGFMFEKPKKLASGTFEFDMTLSGELGWREKNGELMWTSGRVAELSLKMLLDHIEAESIKDRRR